MSAEHKNAALKDTWKRSAVRLIDQYFVQLGIQVEDDSFAASLYSFFIQNIGNPVMLTDAAAHMHLNKDYYGRACRKHIGVGYHELAANIRVLSAKALLSETDYTIEAISKLLHYSTPDYFSRIFKRTTGTTPGSYRNSTNIYNHQHHSK